MKLIAFVDVKTGNRITDFLYDDALFFEDGYAPVKKGDYWGFIDEEGILSEYIDRNYTVAVKRLVNGFIQDGIEISQRIR